MTAPEPPPIPPQQIAPVPRANPQGESPLQFEYQTKRVARSKRAGDKVLNRMATDGWEVVTRVAQRNAYDQVTFRRVKRLPIEQGTRKPWRKWHKITLGVLGIAG